MKNDLDELQRVAQAAAANASRVDLYAGIHKGLRALMADTLLAVGRMDCDDALELAQTTQRVMELLDFCRSHLAHENEFIHPALEARAPGASGVIAHEHEEHERDIRLLGELVTALLQCAPEDRARAAATLYGRLSLFVSHNYEHMYIEETAHNAVLWARYTDAELIDIHNALLASIPPHEMMFAVRWMVPWINPAQRAAMLGDMQAHAPAPAFEAALGLVRPHLREQEWTKLMKSLGLPVERGPLEGC
ncbi:hemerythrin domain-containing protein [Variovorax sp. dw_308]|uniref:hemerythrin domain-containing protein n=1 Tax=Variovorax sp. dw_308 TaxID=2721546 RepID=UPI001C48E2B1|nr:hemerythrin domain-containing protein [Variovorax sp. dw_308]